MKLFTSGQEFKSNKERPVVARIRGFLDGQKDGELFTPTQLTDALSISNTSLMDNRRFLSDYFHIHRMKKYFGNKKTIAYFKQKGTDDPS